MVRRRVTLELQHFVSPMFHLFLISHYHIVYSTCSYLNSSLQTLLSVPGFAADLRSTRDLIVAKHKSRRDDESKAELPLTTAIVDTAANLGVLRPQESSEVQRAGEGGTEGRSSTSSHAEVAFADPKDLKDAIDALTDWFRGFQQQDAHEAIGYLVDALHDELSAAVKATTGSSGDADEANGAKDENILLPTDKYFRLEAKEQNICVDCGFTSG